MKQILSCGLQIAVLISAAMTARAEEGPQSAPTTTAPPAVVTTGTPRRRRRPCGTADPAPVRRYRAPAEPEHRRGGFSVDAADARVGQARSAYYPQISLSGNYNKYSSTLTRPTGPRTCTRATPRSRRTSMISARPPARCASRAWAGAPPGPTRNTASLVVFGVKQAYYNLLQAEKNREVAIETVKLTQDQLDQAKGFFDAGCQSKYDVTSAEVNLSNAKLAQIRADNAVQVGRVTLNNAMGGALPGRFYHRGHPGLPQEPGHLRRRGPAGLREPSGPATPCWRKRKRRRSRCRSPGAAIYPTLTGNANYNRTGDAFVPEQSGSERRRHGHLPAL